MYIYISLQFLALETQLDLKTTYFKSAKTVFTVFPKHFPGKTF